MSTRPCARGKAGAGLRLPAFLFLGLFPWVQGPGGTGHPGRGGAGDDTKRPGQPSFAAAVEAAARGEQPTWIATAVLPRRLELRPLPNPGNGRAAFLASAGTLDVQVIAAVPEWSLDVRILEVRGPAGVTLPPDRFRVTIAVEPGQGGRSGTSPRTTGRLGLAPGKKPPPVAGRAFPGGTLATLRSPGRPRSVSRGHLQIEVRPRWTDLPGRYEARLALQALPPGLIGGGRSVPTARFLPSVPPEVVQLTFSVQPFIALTIPTHRLEFYAGPLEEEVQATVDFQVTTNARLWFVDCEAGLLSGTAGDIQADERITWERLAPDGRPLASGRLSVDSTVVTGTAPGIDVPIRLRFRLETRRGDLAGTYRGDLRLHAGMDH